MLRVHLKGYTKIVLGIHLKSQIKKASHELYTVFMTAALNYACFRPLWNAQAPNYGLSLYHHPYIFLEVLQWISVVILISMLMGHNI